MKYYAVKWPSGKVHCHGSSKTVIWKRGFIDWGAICGVAWDGVEFGATQKYEITCRNCLRVMRARGIAR